MKGMKSLEYYNQWREFYLTGIKQSRSLLRQFDSQASVTKDPYFRELLFKVIDLEREELQKELERYVQNEQKRLACRETPEPR